MGANRNVGGPADYNGGHSARDYVRSGGAPGAGSEAGSGRIMAPDLQPVLAAARDALADRRWAESANCFAQLLSSPGYEAEARYGLGWIELQQGSRDRAQALFREATSCDPQHANSWFALGHLTEARSTEEAIVYYRRALAANPEHYAADQRLHQLGQPPSVRASYQPRLAGGHALSSGATAPDRIPAPSSAAAPPADAVSANGRPAGVSDPGKLGVVDFLRRDNNPIAQDALARIASLERSNRFRFSAYLQQLTVRFIVLVGIATVLAKVAYAITPLTVGSHTIHFYSRNVTQVIVAVALIWGGWALWTLLDCVTNTVAITNGRIRWTHGVLNKHTETLDVWTARDIELERNLMQRLTRDGTLMFKGTLHDRPRLFHKGQFKPLALTGIDHGAELDDVYALLLDLKFLLRAHQGVKGIIQ